MRSPLILSAAVGVSLLAGLAAPAGAAGQPTSTSGQAPSSYTVRPGDTLWDVARRFGTTMSALADANGRRLDDLLLAGHVLRLPGAPGAATSSGTTPAAGPAASPVAATAGGTYLVRTGDTLWGIAERHGLPLTRLLDANGISATDLLLPGRTLTVPAGDARTPASARTPVSPAPASPAPTSGWSARHTVRAGESFSSIAARYGTSPTAVARGNGLSLRSVIVPGQVLQVPEGAAAATQGGGAPAQPGGTPPGLPADLRRRADALALVPVFRSAASEFGVPVDLLMSTAYRESAWQPGVVSPSGAIGVGQLLPATARWVATSLLRQPDLDPWVPSDNIRMSARLLRFLLDLHRGDARLALASYFDGPGTVQRQGVTPVAERYATSILANRAAFA